MKKIFVIASLATVLFGCSIPPEREVNRFQAPPPDASELAAQLDAIPGLQRRFSGHYAGLNEIVAENFPIGSSEELLIAFLNREGFAKPKPPNPRTGGARRGFRLGGDELLAANEERRVRILSGKELGSASFGTECRGGGTSRYKVIWRANRGSVAEIYSDEEICYSPAF